MNGNAFPRWVKPLVWLLCLCPLLWIALLTALGFNQELGLGHAWLDRLGDLPGLKPPVNTTEYLIRSSGLWALRLLCLTLLLTPLRRWTGWGGWVRIRRLVGLFAFFYVCIHLASYIGLDQFLDFPAIVRDIIKRPFITVGMLAFVLLLPLAATSNHAAIRRLGRRWKTLHQLIYLIAPLAVLHFWWMVKKDISQPLLYLLIVAALLGLRLWWWRRDARRS